MIGMVLPCDLQIVMDLLLEGFWGFKSYRSSNPSLKRHLQRPARTIRYRFFRIREHMGFAFSRLVTECWVGANKADRGHELPPGET